MLNPANPGYDQSFFKNMDRGADHAAGVVVPLVLEMVRPTSVLDVGCGTGGWLKHFSERGVADVFGVDGPWVSASQLLIPEPCFRRVDLEKPFSLGRTFDLVVCLEVAEHLPPACAESFIDSLAGHGDVVLFSAAAPYQGGTHHVNEQWLSYWVEKWAQRQYVGVDPLRRRLWDHLGQHETWIYAQNMVFFVKRAALDRYAALLREFEFQGGPPLSLVHPRMYMAHVPADKHVTLRQVIWGFPSIVKRSIKHRLWKRFGNGAK